MARGMGCLGLLCVPDFISTPIDRRRRSEIGPDRGRFDLRTIMSRRPRFGILSALKSLWHALWRAARNRCPACDGAPLFSTFLKPVVHCSSCGEDWTLHNADDFPPYIVILILGHVVITGMTSVEVAFHPPVNVQLAIWIPTVVVLAIGLIQPVKGGVIALQWWHRLGDFKHRRIASKGQDGNSELFAPAEDPVSFASKLPFKTPTDSVNVRRRRSAQKRNGQRRQRGRSKLQFRRARTW